ncbi:hypothetical protein V1477_007411 [Vespula maculifrons]|uniref:Uncharacterized protein n=1 Tax=Vespula maculifrons TaxID=7453 RepID=A0ABD2CJI3_VESMC
MPFGPIVRASLTNFYVEIAEPPVLGLSKEIASLALDYPSSSSSSSNTSSTSLVAILVVVDDDDDDHRRRLFNAKANYTTFLLYELRGFSSIEIGPVLRPAPTYRNARNPPSIISIEDRVRSAGISSVPGRSYYGRIEKQSFVTFINNNDNVDADDDDDDDNDDDNDNNNNNNRSTVN